MLGCGGTLAGVVRILTLLVAGLGCCDGFVVRHDDAGGGGAACRVDVVDVAEIRLVSKAEYESVGDGGASLQGEWMWFMEEVWKMEAPCLEEEDVEGEVFVEVNSTAVEHSSAILQVGTTAVTEIFLLRYGKHEVRLTVSVDSWPSC